MKDEQAGLFELCHRLCTPLVLLCRVLLAHWARNAPVVPQAMLPPLHWLETAALVSHHCLPCGHRGEILPEDVQCHRGIKSAEAMVYGQVLGTRKGSSTES